MPALRDRTERPLTFKYQWRRRGEEDWVDGEASAHSGRNLEMYKGAAWLAMHPDLDHRIVAADGSTTWQCDNMENRP